MRQIIAIALLCLFTFNSLVFSPLFKSVIKQNRREIKNRIVHATNAAEFDVLLVSAQDVEKIIWHDAFEFTYNGKMYDLVSIVKLNNSISKITCINDVKEKELFACLDDYFKNEFSSTTKKGKSLQILMSYFVLSYNLVQPFNLTGIDRYYSLLSQHSTLMDAKILIRHNEINSPPPEFV